jgi:hypothetical protein
VVTPTAGAANTVTLQSYVQALLPVPTYFSTASAVTVVSAGGNTLSASAFTPALVDPTGFFLISGVSVTPCGTQCSAATFSYTQPSSLLGNSGLSKSGGETPTPIGATSPYQSGVGATRARYPYAASCAVQYKNYGALATRQNTNADTSLTLGHGAVGAGFVTAPAVTGGAAGVVSSYSTAAGAAQDPNVLTTSTLLISTSATGVSTMLSTHKTVSAASHVSGATGTSAVFETDNLSFYDYIEQESDTSAIGACGSTASNWQASSATTILGGS